MFHAVRKTMSTVKPSLIAHWTNGSHPMFKNGTEAESFLSLLDSTFLGSYAVGLFISGTLGDRFDPRLVLSIGMWTSAILAFLFGTVSEWMKLYSKFWYLSTWILCGFAQSSGWPTEVCIMGNWFGHGSRGAVLGLWSACASVGNIIGTEISSKVLSLGWGYQSTFLVNASILFIGGLIVFFCLYSRPQDAGLPAPKEEDKISADDCDSDNDCAISSHDNNDNDEVPLTDSHRQTDSNRQKPINFFRAWLLPGVLAYALAYACLKLVNYSFFFWLPYYLTDKFHWAEATADQLSVWYDWGGIVGGFLGGIISDHFLSRTTVVVGMLAASAGALLGYANSPKDLTVNALLMSVAGFFVGGAANLISAAVAADLGRAPEVRESAEALSTVTGIVDGTGSVGASIGQLLVTLVQEKFDWMAVFYMFIALVVCTALCLIPPLYRDFKNKLCCPMFGSRNG